MKFLLYLLALAGLVLTILPSILVFRGAIHLTTHKNLMLIGAFLWFASALFIHFRRQASE